MCFVFDPASMQNARNFFHKRMKDGVNLQERVVVEIKFNINIDELKLN